MPSPLSGSCLCGAVRYTVGVPVSRLRACHCTHCQKSSGAGGSVNAVVPSASFALTQGEPKRYADSGTHSGRTLYRYFCGDCGSPIYSQREGNPELVVVRAGSLDLAGNTRSDMRIATNIWTASARPWAYIDPRTEQHPGNPPPRP